MKQKLWYIIVDGYIHGDDAAVGNFYGAGEHMGEAVDRVLHAAQKVGFLTPRMSEAYYAELDDKTRQELLPLNDHVFFAPTKYFYPADEFRRAFIFPVGIALNANPALKQTSADPDLITTAFTATHAPNKEGEYEINMVLNRNFLKDTFFTCVRLLYPINGVFLRMRGWDDGLDDVWCNATDDPEAICRFLANNAHDTLENGFLEIAVTASERARRTTLILTPHKTIQLRSRLKPVHDAFVAQLEKMGLRHREKLHHIEQGYPHLHYRPAHAKNRRSFERWLPESGFEQLSA
jgi:hypothetical protein